jgi:hypothetical protein
MQFNYLKVICPAITACLAGPLVAHEEHEHAASVLVKTTVGQEAVTELLGHNGLTYKVDTKWAKADFETAPVVNAHALAESRDGHIYLITDHPKNDFIVFKKDGTFVKTISSKIGGGHDIEFIVKNGKEYIIHVDCGWYMAEKGWKSLKSTPGKVTILNMDGSVVRTLPSPQELGVYTAKQKYKPCDVAVTPQGTILIADGYGSNFIIEMTFEGKLIRHWGGSENGKGSLRNAHGISIDTSDPKKPLVWVSSRAENKIKAFTLEGEYVDYMELPGAYAGQLFFRGDLIYTAVCWSKSKEGKGKKLPQSGFVVVMDRKSKKVVSVPGGSMPEYKDGKLQPLYQTHKVFMHCHDLYVDKEGAIYVGEWKAKNRYPYKLTLAKSPVK